MKAIRKRFKKGTAVALTAALLAGLMPALPETAGSVKAADGTTKPPSVSTYATKDQMMDGTFAPENNGTASNYGKLVFGKNSSGEAQEWYILGKDSGVLGDNTILFAASPIETVQMFDSSSTNKTYSNLWSDCNYSGASVKEVYPNHYGASNLRKKLKTIAMNASYFTSAEQDLMNNTTVTTKDTKNTVTYTTTDKLYALAADDYRSTSIKAGSDNSTVLAMSNCWNSGDAFWLRSPREGLADFALHTSSGDWVNSDEVYRYAAVQPASNLKLSYALFASAAKAASHYPSEAVRISSGKAMTLRLDGTGKNIGTVTYNTTTGDIKVVKGSTAQTVSLVVQGNDGTNDWYYNKQIEGPETVNASDIKSALGLTSGIDLSACKIWLETTDSTENLTYAVSATEATRSSISSVAITDIDIPAANTALDTSASCTTTGVSNTAPQITWTPSATTAGYNTSYTASITLTADTGYAFTDATTATVLGNSATSVKKNADGTLTVTYAFPATAKDKLVSIASPQAITVANGTAYDAMNLPATVSIVTEGNTVSSAPVTWDTITPANGSYDPAVLTEQTVTLNGTVDCPNSIDANGTALTTTITITISAAGIVGTPTANPTTGTYTENQSVTLTSSTGGATIYYTTDGSEPTITGGVTGGTTAKYTAPIAVTGTEGQSITTTIKAIAVKSGMQDSSVETFNYTIKQESQTPGVTAPSITTQPGNATVEVGETASFNIVASGTNLTYQWQINRNDENGWVNLTDATATSYTTSTINISCNGFKYRCVVSNDAGTVTSNTAVLTATEPTPTEHTHCVCGTNNLNMKGHSCNKNQVWKGIDDLSEITSGGYYYLKQDVTITSTDTYSSVSTRGNQYCGLKISGDVALCLNGHSIIMQNPEGVTADVDAVMVEGHFVLTDCQGTGTIKHAKDSSGATYQGKGVKVQGGTFDMYGGTITGNTSQYDTGGSGVSVVGVKEAGKSSIFHMYGGTISGNIAKNGGGVEVSRKVDHGPSEFHMYGGTITGNTADSNVPSYGNGGGVYVSWTAKFFMNGGKICGNTATCQGGGVYGSALARYNEYSNGGAAELNVSGSATVIDNKAGGKNNNVYMTSSTRESGYETLYVKLDISDPFSGIIGVSTKDIPVTGKPVVAAASATPGVDYSNHIVSDDKQYKIRHVGYMLMLTTADEPNHQHTWDEGKITKQPTTSEEGVKTYTCTACGATKTEPIEKLVSNTYKIIDGANGKHTIGKDGTLTFRSNAPFSEFVAVLVDGVKVDPSNYDVSKGSTIVRLNQSFLDTLSKGSHTIAIQSRGGTATANFSVTASSNSGNTGTGGTTGGTTGSGTGSTTGSATTPTPSTPTAGITNVQPNGGTQAAPKTTVNAKAPVTGEASPVSCVVLALIIVGGFALLIAELRRSRQMQKKH